MVKASYEQPKLSAFGSLSELTLTGFTNPGDDGCFITAENSEIFGREGSVIPEGNYQCPGGVAPQP
jgi:hypothetical protein